MKKIFLFLFFILATVNAKATSHVFYNFSSHNFLIENNRKIIRPIASITKLITAMTVIESKVNLEEVVKVNGRSNGFVPQGTLMTRMDLIKAMIVSSDNRAAETLANHHPGGFLMFIHDANKLLENKGLHDTKIVDSSGLLPGNISTATELIELLSLIKDNKIILSVAGERQTSINIPKGKKNITINLRNTNPEIFSYDNILISKTGYTNLAGRCVLMLIEKNKELFGVVILGQKTVTERSKLVKEILSVNYLPIVRPIFKTTITDFDLSLNETFTK